MSDNNELELIGTALQGFDRVSAGLALLEKNFKGVLYEVDKPLGMAHAKAARAAIRGPRYELEKIRKDAKSPLLALGKRLDAEAARITNALMELENPIHEQIKFEEDRIEKEKMERAAAEAARAAAIQTRIDAIRKWPVDATGKTSSEIDNLLQMATDYVVIDAEFAERTEEAKGVLMASISALQGIYQSRLNQEAEAERIRQGMLELAKLKAEAAERDRLAREAQAKADADAQAKRDDEAARQAVANRLERERIAKEEADAKAIRDAETKRLADERLRIADEQAEIDRKNEAERQRQADEAGRLTAAREALAKEQAALAEAQKPKPELPPLPKARPVMVKTPDRDEIIAAVAAHFSVDESIARYWLSAIRWDRAA